MHFIRTIVLFQVVSEQMFVYNNEKGVGYMIKDRGTIKWTSLMLPEHVKTLRDWAAEDKLEKKPELDEQAFEQIGIVVMDSLNYTLPIRLTIWENGLFTTFTCIVVKVDLLFQATEAGTTR